MAQLHTIIGAILRDIAQARVTSDIYSREISQYYEKDSLLRLFPVPRSEIREVDFDLKFIMSNIGVDPDRKDIRSAKIAVIFEQYSENIAHDIFENLRGSETIQKITEWVELILKLENDGLHLELQRRILYFFESQSQNLIRQIETDGEINLHLEQDRVRSGILDIIDALIYKREDVLTMNEKYKNHRLLTSVKRSVANGFRDQLNAIDSEIEFLEASEEYKVEVDVTPQGIQEVPEAAISSIRVSSVIRNYNWSQVEEKDNKIIRRLVPE